MNNKTRKTKSFLAFLFLIASTMVSFATPSTDVSVLPVKQYIECAKSVNSASQACLTNVIATAVSNVYSAAPEAKIQQQATAELAAALAAVSVVKGENNNAVAAAAVFEAAIVAAYDNTGTDIAEKLALAKIVAVVPIAYAAPNDTASFTANAGAGLSKAVATEVRTALAEPTETLAELNLYAINDVYQKTLAALRAGRYTMKEDEDALGLFAVPSFDNDSSRYSIADGAHDDGAVYHASNRKNALFDVALPVKKHYKKNPTPTGLN